MNDENRDTIVGYKFIRKDRTSKHGSAGKWIKNRWKKHAGAVVLCEEGFHACRTPLQNLEFVYGDRWVIVEARGEIVDDSEKFVACEMCVVHELPISIVADFAIRCARRSLKHFEKQYRRDKRPREALRAAERVLSEPNKRNIEKALSAEVVARSAADASPAAYAAKSAAYAAKSAVYAAKSASSAKSALAAKSAARSAVYATWSAVWSAVYAAERDWQERTLQRLINNHLKNTGDKQ